jgi:hypothetical protein
MQLLDATEFTEAGIAGPGNFQPAAPSPPPHEEVPMGDIIHQSEITITRVKGPTRKAVIKGFDQPVYYGVHGGIKGFYKVDPEEEHAATLDHVVGAVGG